MKRLSILLSAVMALFVGTAGLAVADTRDIYTIANIPVDKTANTSQAAEAQAFATAKVQGLYRLIERLTLPEDRAAIGDDFYSLANANELTAAVDVDDVRRSSTVYRANLSVVYNPIRLRAQLDQRGVPYVDRPAPKSLIVPIAGGAVYTQNWREAWPQSTERALNAFVTGLSAYSPDSDWSDLQREVNAAGARNAVIAELTGSEGSYSVRLTQVASGGRSAIGTTSPVATLPDAARAASAYLDQVWKRRSIIRGSDGESRAEATIRFSSLENWNALRSALSNSPRVSGFQIEAIARDGALVSFVYAGEAERLTSDLQQSGIVTTNSPQGWTMHIAGDRNY